MIFVFTFAKFATAFAAEFTFAASAYKMAYFFFFLMQNLQISTWIFNYIDAVRYLYSIAILQEYNS